MRLLNTAPEDDVTELLAALAVRSSVYCLSDLGAPWGFEVADASVAKFHEAGARHVILDFVGPYEERFAEIERFAAEVAPLLADLRKG